MIEVVSLGRLKSTKRAADTTTSLPVSRPRVTWRRRAGDESSSSTLTIDRPMIAGAAASADLLVSGDALVSRVHAELDPRPDGLWVRDLGSMNGTSIDGVRVERGDFEEAAAFLGLAFAGMVDDQPAHDAGGVSDEPLLVGKFRVASG